MELHDKTYLAKGKRGIASTALLNGKKVLVKEVNPSSDVDTIAHEAAMLQLVNTKGVGPLFIGLKGGMLVREFIDGEEVGDWFVHATAAQIKKVLLEILDQCRALDLLGVNKQEMTHPHKHILIRKNKPVFIDFDRARKSEKPKNVTQVCQWLTSKDVAAMLAKKKISIDREALLSHAKSYKRDYGSLGFERMREVVRNA